MADMRRTVIPIMLLGDSQVGKTSLILRLTGNKFDGNILTTIGKESYIYETILHDINIKIKIFDTAGQERFKSISQNYIKKANGVLLMYDISDEASFNNIENWMQNIQDNSGNKMCIVLVATKCDLVEERVVSKESGEKLAEKYGIHFYETSSKDNINIEKSFYDIAEQIIEKNKGKKVFEKNIDLNKKHNKKKECCN